VDAEILERLVRADRVLLSPVKHRGAEAQADLTGVRAQLVELRTQTVNTARGLVKPATAGRPGIDPALPPLRQRRDGPHSDAGSGTAATGFLMKMICPRDLTPVLQPGSDRESLASDSRNGARNGQFPRFSRSLREHRNPVHADSRQTLTSFSFLPSIATFPARSTKSKTHNGCE
jgi:hypothetical protein